MAHLVSDLRHGIVVWRDFSVGGPLCELMRIGRDVTSVRLLGILWEILRRILLHLVGADVDGLDELPLKASIRAVSGEVSLVGADSGHRAACWTAAQRSGAGRAGFRVINTKIGVVREHIELVAECLDDGTGKVGCSGRLKVVERLEDDRERAVVFVQGTQIDFGTCEAGELDWVWRYSIDDDRRRAWCLHSGGQEYLIACLVTGGQCTLHGDSVSADFHSG